MYQKSHIKSLKPKFKKKTELASLNTLGEVRSGSLKTIFWGELLHAMRAFKTTYTLRYNVIIYAHYNVTIHYTYYKGTIYAYCNVYYDVNNMLYYNVTIPCDMTLLMTLFEALPIAAGF